MPQNALALLTDLLCAHEAASSFGCGLEPHLIERMIDRHCCSVEMPVFAARAGENDQHFAASWPRINDPDSGEGAVDAGR